MPRPHIRRGIRTASGFLTRSKADNQLPCVIGFHFRCGKNTENRTVYDKISAKHGKVAIGQTSERTA